MSDAFAFLQLRFLTGSYLRSINYHNTPAASAAWYERQLAFYATHFSSVNERDLESFSTTGRWHKAKPGLIHAFYNGARNNYDVMKPLLEHYGFVGWFFIPSDFASTAPPLQRSFAEAHGIRLIPDEYPDGRIAMSWQEIRELDGSHVVASHTKTHSRISPDSTKDVQREIVASQQDFERQLGHKVSSFAFLSGSALGIDPEADRYLHEAGYRFLFSNFKVQKLA